jgi:predicted ester cyclase
MIGWIKLYPTNQPTNKKVMVQVIAIDRLSGGKFVETWSRTDTLGMMQQLGAIPVPKK